MYGKKREESGFGANPDLYCMVRNRGSGSVSNSYILLYAGISVYLYRRLYLHLPNRLHVRQSGGGEYSLYLSVI
jgi:hypothetical protein